ncbi:MULTISPECIES: hypothetical protein [unclassified Butyrivibrio]|uniref:hypothetical protein n=1 Tax=unclassified Butyrivibrio TaxID=2639466 RepID=UPI0003B3C1BA|nr:MULTISPECIES: hypothetical protein [unclassified Butyrivibrio]SDB62021.1 hypothetical protein SAMN02910263_03333 [Butyrivibrio sp. INlla16]SEL31148.1 hypothetical protein SAMN04487770_108129 [Butyrivibrio sp. ob235]
MGKIIQFDKNDPNIIDTVECNGRYTDVATLRNKVITAGAVLVAAAAFVCAQFFFI